MTMASRAFQLAMLLAAAGAGFGLSRWAPPPATTDETPRQLERLEGELRALRQALEATSRPAPPAVAGLDVAALRDDLRRMMREELQATRDEISSSPPEEKPRPPPPLPPRNPEAFAKASQLVERSISSRQWGEQERGELITLRPQLTTAQFQELFQKLAVAMNSQQLRVTTRGPPF
ncbi:hypothetical protein D7X96_19640 [Corallococcus interemptor]|uniref:Periplasmic heavy metal sensor n=2 Tax=Corallococcus TaxID=83461 RepID=A0A3A8QLT1_9BACT|nr:hypothetical protein [Corallococcus interemptor]RKH67315.1 hypothetical protein D7X96_19640 [Corallococcus interemptor]